MNPFFAHIGFDVKTRQVVLPIQLSHLAINCQIIAKTKKKKASAVAEEAYLRRTKGSG